MVAAFQVSSTLKRFYVMTHTFMLVNFSTREDFFIKMHFELLMNILCANVNRGLLWILSRIFARSFCYLLLFQALHSLTFIEVFFSRQGDIKFSFDSIENALKSHSSVIVMNKHLNTMSQLNKNEYVENFCFMFVKA